MTDTADVAVEKALLDYLSQIALSPAVPISMPYRRFNTPDAVAGAKWLRANYLPATKIALGVDDNSANQISGIFQVDALYYISDDGELPLARFAQSVMNWFARGTKITIDNQEVHIWHTPYRGRAMKDDPWVFIPVSIPFIAFSTNPA
jgi:hypothetical protein